MTKQNWDMIYTAGEQLNRYPYDFIVSNFYRYRNRFGSKINILDLGCGAGNHSLFFAENGAMVTAVDYSRAVLKVLEQRAIAEGLDEFIDVALVDFEDFEMPTTKKFDIVIDRLSVSHVARGFAKEVYSVVNEHMNPGAILMCNLFSIEHAHKDYGVYDHERSIWHSFHKGLFKNLKTACFYGYDDVKQLFCNYEIESLCLESETDLLDNNNRKEIWKIIAKKI